MEEQLITYKTAKLALSKGITWRKVKVNLFGYISKFYASTGTLISYGRTGRLNIDKAPFAFTQSLLQRWLREKYSIHVHVCIPSDTKWITQLHKGPKTLVEDSYHNTYEEALEAGLQEALKLV